MNKQELIKFFKNNSAISGEAMYLEEGEKKSDNRVKLFDGLCEDWETVDEHGGMDQGSEYYNVIRFTTRDGEVFFLQFYGWYASHYGSEYQGVDEVFPQQVIKTNWVNNAAAAAELKDQTVASAFVDQGSYEDYQSSYEDEYVSSYEDDVIPSGHVM